MGRRRSRQNVIEPDFVVSTEFLPRSRTEAIILVISNRRFLCVRAYVRGGGGGGSGEWSGNSGGVSGGGGGGVVGGGGLRGSGITGLELEWQVSLDALSGLPALLNEDGGGTTLDFTNVAAETEIYSSRRRDARASLRRHNHLHMGRMAGLAAVAKSSAASKQGSGGGGDSETRGDGGHDNTSGIAGNFGGGGHGNSGSKPVRPRRVEGLYRDRPALIRAYNVVACLTNRLNGVLLTPGGMNVRGSTPAIRSYFPRTGADGDLDNSQTPGGSPDSSFGLGIICINGWEFGEDPRKALVAATGRNSWDVSAVGPTKTPPQRFKASNSPKADGARLSAGGGFQSAVGLRSERNLPPPELWQPLWLLVPQVNDAPADTLRPVPNTFEMDAVPWRPGPYAPDADSGSGWLSAARTAALQAPGQLMRCGVFHASA